MTDFLAKLKAMSNRQGEQNSAKAGSQRSSNTNVSNGEGKTERPQISSSQSSTSILSWMKELTEKSRLRQRRGRAVDPSGKTPGNRSVRQQFPLYQKWWAWGILGVGFGLGGTVIAVRETVVAIEHRLPNTKEALTFVRTGTLTIKAADGTILQQMGPATRSKVMLQEMPDRLPQAFIASEDQDFYRHEGVDYQAILRASLANLTSGQVMEGGSTITQQLARIVFLDQRRSLGRKLKEALLAQKMEHELNKDQILERYLNLVYLGSGAYGVADAAWIYFSKKVNQLTVGEMAMIAGMAPAPSVYSPLINPDLARERRNTVLGRMVSAGFITPSERDAAIASPITLKPGAPRYVKSEAPYFTSYVQQQLPQYVSKEDLELGGLTVETSLDLKWQKQGQETVKRAISDYGPGDGFEQAALVAIDPRDGEIKALVGGDDFEKSQFNRATQAQRQPGSTFKAFVYSTAIAAGFSPYRSYVDGKYSVDGYEPHNYSKRYRGSVSMRDALTSSINIVAVKVLVDVGFQPVIDMAKRMGIKSNLLPTYSLALGTSEVNLLELTSAYGTLANQGNHVEPHGILRVLDRFGKVIYTANFQSERAIDEQSASIMTWMLEGVVQGGTGGNAALADRQVAGKTGTSEKRRDLWFIGYIPQLVTGVWLGNDDSSPTYGASSTAALTWYDFMHQVINKMPVEKFPQLPDLEDRKGTIKAKPVQPRKVYASNSGGYSEETSDSEEAGSNDSSGSDYSSGSSSGYSSDYSGSSEGYSSEGSSSGASSQPSEPSRGPAPSSSGSASTAPPEPGPAEGSDSGSVAPAPDLIPPPPSFDAPTSDPISEPPPPAAAPIQSAPEPAPPPAAPTSP